MKLLKRLFSPLMTLISIQLVWVLMVVLWINWFVGRHYEIRRLTELYRPDLVGRGLDWPVLVEGIVLLVIVLAGVYIIFVYWKRQADLVEQQKDFMSQVTHELKSPLASIQLHLETIKLRKPAPDKLERFLDTMLSDTERLNSLISNLLMAASLERRRQVPHYPEIDFSELVERILERKQAKLPEGGSLSVNIEKGIRASVNPEAMEIIIRNLFENAVLYSPGAPDIQVTLTLKGKKAIVYFKDCGRGLDRKDLRQVFKMFYRVRTPDENIRGTGLGLYIIRSLIKEHGGSISVASDGSGKGCTFIITLPVTGQSTG